MVFIPIFTEVQASQLIRVGVYDNPPKIFINENGNPDGIFIDVLKSIVAKNDYTIEYVQGNWSELFESLREGKIDILPDMAYSRERDSLFIFSIPVISSWLQVFTTSSKMINKTEDLQNKRIGVLDSSNQETYVKSTIKKDYNIEYSVFTFDTYTHSVQALHNNQIDALIADRFFYFSELCDKNVLPSGVILQITTLHFAFAQSVHPQLVEMVNQKITYLFNNPTSDYYRSLQKWYNKHKTIVPVYIKWIIVILALAMCVFLLFTVLLRKRVKAKTRILDLQNHELKAAKERAEESDRLKTAFLQNLSHEIRTPMNGILGFMNLLQEPELDYESQKQYVDIINKSGERLLTTMNEIIEISRIEASEIEVNTTVTDVEDILQLLYQQMLPKAHAKGVELKLNQQLSPGEYRIKTDKALLNGILTNLMNNALKFTDSGQIELGVIREGSHFMYYVKDTGIGIPAERLTSIFDRFINADQQASRLFEGSGLGLTIVKAYVELLHGTVWVESEPGKGSTFFVKIPVS